MIIINNTALKEVKAMTSSKIPRLSAPIFSSEFRLGLVLYGGVSLAVYMNGICQEFYNATRGRGIYKLIKALTDSDIVVDIISGTSAGGVNGVLLGYAIANTTRDKLLDFNSFAGLWREQGDIRNLIRKSAPFTSFLDGEGFYQQILENAFKQNLENVSDNHDWYSDFGELDLFITATDFQGRDTKTFDHTGNVIDVKDHKVVFCLKYRQDQIDYIDNPFSRDDNNIKALATLCRATSCFPIAFPVVEVSLYPPDEQSKYPLHKKLVDWGNLQNRDLPKEYLNGNKPYTIKLVDGGVLNNRPFTYAVETIYSRVAYRNAERILFYLDPTPDRFQEDIKQKNSEDSPWEIASKSKIGIPNYQSINKDLQLIEEGNLKVNRYKLLRASVESSIDFNNLPQRNDPTYLHCRFFALIDNCIRQILVKKSAFIKEDEEQRRFLNKVGSLFKNLAVSEHIDHSQYLRNICSDESILRNIDINFFIKKYCFILGKINELNNKKTRNFAQKRTSDLLKEVLSLRYLAYQLSWQLELLKLLRKSTNLILQSYNFLELMSSSDVSQVNFEEIYKFCVVFYAVLLDKDLSFKEVDASTGKLLDNYYDLCNLIQNDLHHDNYRQKNNIDLSNLKMLLPEYEPSRFQEIFKQIYEFPVCQILVTKDNYQERDKKIHYLKHKVSKKEQDLRPKEVSKKELSIAVSQSILPEIDKYSEQCFEHWSKFMLPEDKELLENYFKNYLSIDSIIFPYEYLSDIVTKNPIKVSRISPEDAKKGYSHDVKYQKVFGNQLNNFGGFFERFYRSNDLLWGRMDGLNRLVDTLVDLDAMKRFALHIQKRPHHLSEEEYIEQLMEESLPHATVEERDYITNYMLDFYSYHTGEVDDTQAQNCYIEHNYEKFVHNIVKAGQREILYTDFPGVWKDIPEAKYIKKETKKNINSIGYNDIPPDKIEYCFEKYEELKLQKNQFQLQGSSILLGFICWGLQTNFFREILSNYSPKLVKFIIFKHPILSLTIPILIPIVFLLSLL